MSTPGAAQGQLAPTAFSFVRSQPKRITKQLEEALVIALADASSIDDLPEIVWRSRRFILESHLDKKRSRGRRSWISTHGDFLAELTLNDTIRNIV